MRSFLILMAMSTAVYAQTETFAGGVVGDSSIAAPAISWTRISPDDDRWTIAVSGWELSTQYERSKNPRQKAVMSLAVTPIHAHSSDRIYVRGERRRDLEFDDSAVEATFGRIDNPAERWASDVRAVLLYERVPNRDRWSQPYAGIRARQTYGRVTADNPFLMTFEGAQVGATVEVFAGRKAWSRVELNERAGRRIGSLRVAQTLSVFSGNSLDTVNAFLIGGSWPIAGAHPLYGYRYGEFRVARGVSATGEIAYALGSMTRIAAHGSALRSPDIRATGMAASVTHDWNGIGVRLGVAFPRQQSRDRQRPVLFASVLAASFR